MRRKKIRQSRYAAAFFFTISIFLAGYILGETISERKLEKVYDLENDLRVESFGNELLFFLVTQDYCTNTNLTSYTKYLTETGRKLTHMEDEYGHDSSQVISMKNYYTLLMIRHYLIFEKANELCNYTNSEVLYFYTNDGTCEDCEDQGLVVTNVHRKDPDFNIYSFEYNLENPALDFLKEKHGISHDRLPTLVIDGEVFYGFQSKESLNEILG